MPNGDDWFVVATEAGHVSLRPRARRRGRRSSGDRRRRSAWCRPRWCVGRGLERLYHAMHPRQRRSRRAASSPRARRATQPRRRPSPCSCACSAASPAMSRSPSRRPAASISRGGVARALRLAVRLRASFRTAFEAHPPYEPMLGAIPTFLVTYTEPGLVGCAAYRGADRSGASARPLDARNDAALTPIPIPQTRRGDARPTRRRSSRTRRA